MQISQDGIDLIKYFEGCPTDDNGNVVSYRCAANKATIGFGSLKLIDGSPVQDGMTISKQDAEDLVYDLSDKIAKDTIKQKHDIEFRKGEYTRCKSNYCSVAEFCTQFEAV